VRNDGWFPGTCPRSHRTAASLPLRAARPVPGPRDLEIVQGRKGPEAANVRRIWSRAT